MEITLQIRISDTLVSLERNSDYSGNGLLMGREQAEIGSSHMVHVMPRKPTWLHRCVKGAANSELSQLVG